MLKIENECVGCAIPCIDCGRKRVPVYYCDRCGDQIDDIYESDGEELCESCLLDKHRKEF